MDLTSPRRSSRNHASTLALDVAMSMTSSLKDGVEGVEMEKTVEKKEDKKKGPRDSSASSSTSKKSTAVTVTAAAGKKNGEVKKKETPAPARGGKRRVGMSPSDGKRRRRKRSETESEESSEDEEDEIEEPVKPKPQSNNFSVSRLIGEPEPHREIKRRLDIPDDDALPFPTSILFGDDAMGKLVGDRSYPPTCTEFNVGGIKYLPLSNLMDDDGFTVSVSEPVTYQRTDGVKQTASLSDALMSSGMTVKRRTLGKEFLNNLRTTGLIVHWAFIAHLAPQMLKKLQHERDKARKLYHFNLGDITKQIQMVAAGGNPSTAMTSSTMSGMASDEVVKKTVAELIEERKRRNGTSTETGTGSTGGGLLSGITFKGTGSYTSPTPTTSTSLLPSSLSLSAPSLPSSTIFPASLSAVNNYRPRSGLDLDALMRAKGMTVSDIMQIQMQMSGVSSQTRREPLQFPSHLQSPHLTPPSSSGGMPLRISDPDHLNKFIGLLNGDKEGSPLSQPNSSAFADFDHVPSLSVTEKILLISDYDGGSSEAALAVKYKVPIDRIPGIIRLRVPLIREQTRVYMERRRSSKLRALPVRRTNFVGLNIMMWRFFKDCRDRGIALTGRQLKEHAMTIASQLGLSNFKGSEGWLDAFKRRHKIDLRTMTGEAVNYESDPDGNIICTSADGADDDDYSGSYDETTRSSSSPAAGDTTTDQLLASVTAIVNNEGPVLPAMMMDILTGGAGGSGEEEDERMEEGEISGDGSFRGSGLGTSGLQAFQPNYADPRMAANYRLDESSLITNIIRSTATHVPNPEVARALDILRSYIVTHDPAAIGFFVDLQTRLASTIAAHQTIENCAAVLAAAQSGESNGVGAGLLNGVGGMSDQSKEVSQDDQKTPPMVDGAPKEEESAESSETSGEKAEEKENEEGKDKAEENAAASENGAVNSSHDSTTSEDSNDD